MATVLGADLYYFPHMGYRPYKWVTQRDQYGDKPIRIVDDYVYDGKYHPGKYDLMTSADIPIDIPMGEDASEPFYKDVPASQSVTIPPALWAWNTPSLWNPPGCWCPGTETPSVPPIIDPAPVPLPASAVGLIVGLAALAALKRKMVRR